MDASLDPATAMRERLRAALKRALTSRDERAARALRSAIAALDNAEATVTGVDAAESGVVAGAALGVGATEVARRRLSAQEVSSVVHAEMEDRLAAAAGYEALGKVEIAAELRAEAAALRAFAAAPPAEPTA